MFWKSAHAPRRFHFGRHSPSHFVGDCRGVTAIEYAMVGSVVSIVITFLVVVIGEDVGALMTELLDVF